MHSVPLKRLSDLAESEGARPEVFTPARTLSRNARIVAFPYDWQCPAATEKAAYESLLVFSDSLGFNYLGIPWATLIDCLRSGASVAAEILLTLRQLERPDAGSVVTVVQHIHALNFIELFAACGVTDIFWPHARAQQPTAKGIRVHAFPLFPAQTPDSLPPKEPNMRRRYLANFIGAYNPKLYLSRVRRTIWADMGKRRDLLIVKREAWHFERTVYEEQAQGVLPNQQRLIQEEAHKREYLDAIKDSFFTLCPTGSGPNSIRIFESLCLGSIPIILTKDLRLPGPPELWAQAALIEEDSDNGYRRALVAAARTSLEERRSMLVAGFELLRFVGPAAYGDLIVNGMAVQG